MFPFRSDWTTLNAAEPRRSQVGAYSVREEKDMQKGDTPNRPTRPSEALKKARVSTPASVMGTSAKD